jgi:hypothetical protein
MKFLRYLAMTLALTSVASEVKADNDYKFFQYKHAPGGALYIEPADEIAFIQQCTQKHLNNAFLLARPNLRANSFARKRIKIDEVIAEIQHYKNLAVEIPYADILDPEGDIFPYDFVKADGSCWTQNDFADVIQELQNARNVLENAVPIPMEM